MENNERTKVTIANADLNWTPRKVVTHYQCKCAECQRLTAWTKGYQKYLRRVDR